MFFSRLFLHSFQASLHGMKTLGLLLFSVSLYTGARGFLSKLTCAHLPRILKTMLQRSIASTLQSRCATGTPSFASVSINGTISRVKRLTLSRKFSGKSYERSPRSYRMRAGALADEGILHAQKCLLQHSVQLSRTILAASFHRPWFVALLQSHSLIN